MELQDFVHSRANVNGIQLHYRVGGTGSPVVLLHGWPQHSLMWHTVAPRLAQHHTVLVPDLRGAGGSSIPAAGYDKKSMAEDIVQLLQHLGHEQVDLVGYDLGAGVAYSLAAQHPERVRRLVVMEFGLAGFGYEQYLTPDPQWNSGSNWHLSLFTVPEVAEFAFRGRERELLSWFFWHLSCNPSAVSQEHFEQYVRDLSRPGALRAGIEYYAAVWRDARDNQELARNKLKMPVLALGGQHSAGPYVAALFQPVADNVRSGVVPEAGHWLADENPHAVAEQLLGFFAEP